VFSKRVFFRMSRIVGRTGLRTTTAFLHLDVVGVEFNVLGAVEDALGVVVGVGRNGSGALAADCGGEVVVVVVVASSRIGLVVCRGGGAGGEGEEGEVGCEEGTQTGGVGADDAGC